MTTLVAGSVLKAVFRLNIVYVTRDVRTEKRVEVEKGR